MTRKEIELLAELDHPHIVRLFEYAEDRALGQFTFVLEYVPGGDCLRLLRRAGRGLDEPLVASLARQLLLALSHCHRREIVHRDVKPENLLVGESGVWGDLVLKLIDFGLAMRGSTREFMGTAAYMAPELVSEEEVTMSSDMWSAGVTTAELLSTVALFGKAKDYGGRSGPVLENIRMYRRLDDCDERMMRAKPAWSLRSREADLFVRRLLRVNPIQRPSASVAERDPWLEMYRVAPAGLTGEMLRSLAFYAHAPSAVRCCLLAIAVRASIPELDELGAAFLSMDKNGNGIITHAELRAAVEKARYWWDPEVDVEALIRAADLGNSGGVMYTEFVAACLYTQHGCLDDLFREAFCALDSDGDGKVDLKDIQPLFRERDLELLAQLPADGPFGLADWRRCMRMNCVASTGLGPQSAECTGFLGGLFCNSMPRTSHDSSDILIGTGPSCFGGVSSERNYMWQEELLETVGLRNLWPLVSL